MRLSPSLPIVSTAFAIGAMASPAGSNIARRQSVEPLNGIIEPTAGTSTTPGSTFSFQYTVDNFCEDGYSLLTVWIVPGPSAPTSASLNSSEEFSPGTYLAFLGSFLVKNFAREYRFATCKSRDGDPSCRVAQYAAGSCSVQCVIPKQGPVLSRMDMGMGMVT